MVCSRRNVRVIKKFNGGVQDITERGLWYDDKINDINRNLMDTFKVFRSSMDRGPLNYYR